MSPEFAGYDTSSFYRKQFNLVYPVLMTKLLTPKDCPPHQALQLTAQERADLPDIRWISPTAPKYKHLRSVGAIGKWAIGHPSPNRDGFEPVTISYSPPVAEGEDYNALMEKLRALEAQGLNAGDQEWDFEFSKMSEREIGYAYDQDAARTFIELARRQEPGQDPIKILTEGGFKLEHTIEARSIGMEATQVFYKEDAKRGHFTVFYSPGSMHLTHEKRGASCWSNLLRLGMHTQTYDDFFMAHTLSPEIADPMCAALEMAVKISKEWTPAPAVRRSRKASP
jgi:hypothetical protein